MDGGSNDCEYWPAHTLRDWDQERAGRIDVRKDRKKDQAQRLRTVQSKESALHNEH